MVLEIKIKIKILPNRVRSWHRGLAARVVPQHLVPRLMSVVLFMVCWSSSALPKWCPRAMRIRCA